MDETTKDGPHPDSLPAAFWSALECHRKEIERIPVEQLGRRRKCVQDHQAKLSALVDQMLEFSRLPSPTPEVWFTLGSAHQLGFGVQKSRDEALRWYRRAAEAAGGLVVSSHTTRFGTSAK
jgi:hypothetical protein